MTFSGPRLVIFLYPCSAGSTKSGTQGLAGPWTSPTESLQVHCRTISTYCTEGPERRGKCTDSVGTLPAGVYFIMKQQDFPMNVTYAFRKPLHKITSYKN